MSQNENPQKGSDPAMPAATCSGVVRAAKSAGIVGLHAENGLTLHEAILILDEINRARGFDCQNLPLTHGGPANEQ